MADEIEQKIRSGEFPPGHKLPSTAELARQHHVNTATAYRAMRELHSRELVYEQQGQGVFVAESTRRPIDSSAAECQPSSPIT